MTIWTRLRRMLPRSAPHTAAGRPPARKDVAGAGVLSWIPGWDGAWGGRSYAARVEAGYRRNAVAYRCVRLIAECAASVPLRLVRAGAAVAHPVHERLLRHPNPATSGAAFFDRLYTALLLAGEAYLLRLPEDRPEDPQEFHLLSPERIRKEGRGRGPWPARYVLEGEDGRRVFGLDPLTGRGAVLHLVEPHPRDPLTPLARAEVAADAIDVHNAAQAWNKALLDNAARPSGAFVVEARDGTPATLSDAQFARLKADIEALFQGARNAGRPLLLEGGLKWQPMAFSPADMDFINLKHTAARDIALAFGVPPMLLGIPGDNTYSNYQEANRAFWRLTVLPLLRRVADELTAWLADALPPDARLEPDRDEIARRTGERDSFWRELDQLSFLTAAEKRRLAGIEELFSSQAPSGLAPHAAKGVLLREPAQEERNRVCNRLSAELYALNKNADDIIETVLRLNDQLERETADADSDVQNTILQFAKNIVDGALTIRELLQSPASIARLGSVAAGTIFSLASLISANNAVLQYVEHNKRIETIVTDIDYHLGKLREMRDMALQKLKEMRSMGCPLTF